MKPGNALQTALSLINWLSNLFPPKALWRRHAQIVLDSSNWEGPFIELCSISYRPCVAGLFYKHLCHSLIHWVILLFRIFKTLYIPNNKSWGADFLRECSPHYVSSVSYHVSGVRCHMTGVTCNIIILLFFFYHFIFLSDEARRWRVCYQRGLHCLVYLQQP